MRLESKLRSAIVILCLALFGACSVRIDDKPIRRVPTFDQSEILADDDDLATSEAKLREIGLSFRETRFARDATGFELDAEFYDRYVASLGDETEADRETRIGFEARVLGDFLAKIESFRKKYPVRIRIKKTNGTVSTEEVASKRDLLKAKAEAVRRSIRERQKYGAAKDLSPV